MLDRTKKEQGTKKSMEIPVEGYPPLHGTVISGKYPGKRLVITAGVHGGEYVGILAAKELIHELNPSVLHGELVILPVVNEAGFYQGAKQIVPEDGVNLNRAFPGDHTKSAARRIAAAVEEYLYPRTDFLVDLHGGDINEGLVPLVFFPAAAGKAVEEAARAAAKLMAVCFRVPSMSANGLYSQAAHQGIPAMLLERGCRGQWTREEVAACKKDMHRLMEYLEIEPPQAPSAREKKLRDMREETDVQKEMGDMRYLEAAWDGFWFPYVKEGERARRGDLLGRLEDREGKQVKQYTAEFDGVVLYYTMSLGVRKGDPLIAYGRSLE